MQFVVICSWWKTQIVIVKCHPKQLQPISICNGRVDDAIEIKREIDIKGKSESFVELIERDISTEYSVTGELQGQQEEIIDYIHCSVVKEVVKDEINTKVNDKPKSSRDKESKNDTKGNEEKPTRSPNETCSLHKRKKSSNLKKKSNINAAKGTLQRHKCDSCEYVTKYKSTLKLHVFKHTGERPFGCNHCEKQFMAKESLQHHMKVYVNKFLFHCSVCFQGFDRKNEKMNHESECRTLRYQCHLCKGWFGSKKQLIHHICACKAVSNPSNAKNAQSDFLMKVLSS